MILMGGIDTRAKGASALYANGFARKIIFAETESTDLTRAQVLEDEATETKKALLYYGIPESAIEIISGAGIASTYDEALALKTYLSKKAQRPSRIIVVTNWSHSGRARWYFKTALESLGIKCEVIPLPLRTATPQNWWQEEEGVIQVQLEYIKHFYGRLRADMSRLKQ